VAKGKPQQSLTETVLANAHQIGNGCVPWYEAIPAEVSGELDAIRRQYHSGELRLKRMAIAKSISKALREREIVTIGMEAVDRWLAMRPD
jgi:hypothetical protein